MRERPSDPEATGGVLPYRGGSSTTTALYCEEFTQATPPRGELRAGEDFQDHTALLHTLIIIFREFLESWERIRQTEARIKQGRRLAIRYNS